MNNAEKWAMIEAIVNAYAGGSDLPEKFTNLLAKCGVRRDISEKNYQAGLRAIESIIHDKLPHEWKVGDNCTMTAEGGKFTVRAISEHGLYFWLEDMNSFSSRKSEYFTVSKKELETSYAPIPNS